MTAWRASRTAPPTFTRSNNACVERGRERGSVPVVDGPEVADVRLGTRGKERGGQTVGVARTRNEPTTLRRPAPTRRRC